MLRHDHTVLPANYTCKLHHVCLSFVSVHQMAPPRLRYQTSNCSLLLIYRPGKDERLSWPDWLTYSGRFTHISGYPSAAGRAQDRESSLAKDRRSTTVPRNKSTYLLSCEAWLGQVVWHESISHSYSAPGLHTQSLQTGVHCLHGMLFCLSLFASLILHASQFSLFLAQINRRTSTDRLRGDIHE